VAEDALAKRIEDINRERVNASKAGEEVTLAEGGAVAVIKVGSGDVLALASYPSYNLATFTDDYADLLSDPLSPLYNRATQGTYTPGSTFKPVTAIAGLQEGVIGVGTKIYDKGIIDEYEGYTYKCWIYPGSHGNINVKEALQVSCNYFFYKVGSEVGIDRLSKYAAAFGLGQPTGIELYEETGVLATRPYKERTAGEKWYMGDTLQASIGQSYNLFTPLQLASYAATLASDGSRYAAHILKIRQEP
jgi:penicillin-binding protein 2